MSSELNLKKFSINPKFYENRICPKKGGAIIYMYISKLLLFDLNPPFNLIWTSTFCAVLVLATFFCHLWNAEDSSNCKNRVG